MGHLVRYRSADGESHLEDVADLEAALALVEQLHGQEGTTDVRVFREVPLKIQTYVKVMVDDEAAPAPSAAESAPQPSSAPMEPPPGAMPLSPPPAPQPASPPTDVDVTESDRRSLFHRN